MPSLINIIKPIPNYGFLYDTALTYILQNERKRLFLRNFT